MTSRKHIVIDARIRRTSTGRYVARLLDHLQTIDTFHRYTVLVQPDDDWSPTAPNFHTLPCPYAQFSFNPLEQIGFTWQLIKLKPHLVHFTMTQQPLLYFGNIVTTTHDLTMFTFIRRGMTNLVVYWLKMKLYRFLFIWSHWKSKKIIVPTKFVAADLIRYQSSTKKRVVVTYEAGDLPSDERAEQPKMVHANDKFIMYVGAAFPHKNLPKLVDAFNILKKTYPDLKLVLVGKREVNSKELEAYAKKYAAAKDIIFTGFVSNGELKWLFEHTSVYVFPSLSEGFGLPALEAMAYGTPVASSNASCLPEVYEDAVIYFDPKKPHDIAEKISTVLDDASLQKDLAKKGYKQIKKYSWHTMAEETLLVYKETLGEVTED